MNEETRNHNFLHDIARHDDDEYDIDDDNYK